MKHRFFALALFAAPLLGAVALTPLVTTDVLAQSDEEVLYWVAPMDPNYRRDEPGKSPMGMDLIPVYAGDVAQDGSGASTVKIDSSVANNIGVRTASVDLAILRPPIHTVGRIMYDEERVARIHLRANGWIERLAVRAEGEAVEKGDLLFEVYAPDLVNAQAEFLQTLKSGRPAVIKASRARLLALDISDRQLREIERSGQPAQYIKVFAPISGIVTALNVADGQYVTPGTQIMALADLSQVWLMSDVFERQAGQLETGAAVVAETKFDTGAPLKGQVDYIYPDLDPVMRTVPVRTILDNPDQRLKPGMFMTVKIDGRARPETTVIPREALIRTGRQERVILAMNDGRYQPAAVKSGVEDGGRVEILSGLNAGERVVTSGQFLIDSESSFSGATLRLAGAQNSNPMASNQSQMDHSGHGDTQSMEAVDHEMSSAEAGLAHASGTILDIMPDKRMVRLKHGPIDGLGMMAMTMNFMVRESVDLTVLQTGMDVDFMIGTHNGNPYAVHKIEPKQ
jgi:Cu(I)/Ag(I) efflux system membrane fusion protein